MAARAHFPSGCGLKIQLGFIAATLSCAGAQESTAAIQVVDHTASAGLTATHMPDEQCFGPEVWMTGGIGVGDFNRDGWPDVFMVGGGLTPDRLFINNGNGTFTDRAAAWGVAISHGGNGVAVGDYNDDTWLDIYVTSFGPSGLPGQPGQHRLYRNNGNSSFSEVAQQAGVNWTTTLMPNGYGAAFGDYDLDGDLDLFVASWRDGLGEGGNLGTGNKLFRNNGDATFSDVTADALNDAMVGVWGFQPAFVDMDGDIYPEILLASDFETSRYLVNNGDGTFTNSTVPSGTGRDDNGMGQTVGDFNNDGWLDWYVTSIFMDTPNPGHYNGNTLYVSQGAHQYLELAAVAGVSDGGWGWGTLQIDLDHDGWLDILEVNGRPAVGGEWYNERGYMFRNDGDGTFTEIGVAAGFNHYGEGRSLARLDADRDGDQDFLVSVNNGQLLFYRNQTPNAGAWITITFDTGSNPRLAPNGYGTRVTATIGKQSFVQYLSGSPSYLATSEPAIHFGLAQATKVDTLRIDWPRGQVTVLQNVPVNQFLRLDGPPLADITGDGRVNVSDLLQLLAAWGACKTGSPCTSDLDNNGNTNVSDLLTVISNWTP